MKDIFEQLHTKEILDRIDLLGSDTKAQWGKMNPAQMLAHCSSFQDIAMGNQLPPRSLLGMVVGKLAAPIFYNDKPLPQNMSTISTLIINNQREFETEKEKLKQKLITFQTNGPHKCTAHPHPFFGKLTSEQWGKGIYKHLDHHLKQFNV
ncbi:DUF1569 domain-containing protein [Alkalihalobacillus trypoxylicola]|uniref:DUF1569 domain-containing protein n=1 Tax=Alkalihalobacillus trypoxylicola TaxID=519424 RepID=A0A162F3J8_9BACI|nr:DUF1569 domain-containing protein [Alkalihalobacillus trypoxylicola]KYG34416.1 hypothetical protein AZF04_14625 [Alkalihalobacillus trypoxylicola]